MRILFISASLAWLVDGILGDFYLHEHGAFKIAMKTVISDEKLQNFRAVADGLAAFKKAFPFPKVVYKVKSPPTDDDHWKNAMRNFKFNGQCEKFEESRENFIVQSAVIEVSTHRLWELARIGIVFPNCSSPRRHLRLEQNCFDARLEYTWWLIEQTLAEIKDAHRMRMKSAIHLLDPDTCGHKYNTPDRVRDALENLNQKVRRGIRQSYSSDYFADPSLWSDRASSDTPPKVIYATTMRDEWQDATKQKILLAGENIFKYANELIDHSKAATLSSAASQPGATALGNTGAAPADAADVILASGGTVFIPAAVPPGTPAPAALVTASAAAPVTVVPSAYGSKTPAAPKKKKKEKKKSNTGAIAAASLGGVLVIGAVGYLFVFRQPVN